MEIKETYIVWSSNHNQYVKLHRTFKFVSGLKNKQSWFIEINNTLDLITTDTAMDLLKDH
jgi:hypothetical protein